MNTSMRLIVIPFWAELNGDCESQAIVCCAARLTSCGALYSLSADTQLEWKVLACMLWFSSHTCSHHCWPHAVWVEPSNQITRFGLCAPVKTHITCIYPNRIISCHGNGIILLPVGLVRSLFLVFYTLFKCALECPLNFCVGRTHWSVLKHLVAFSSSTFREDHCSRHAHLRRHLRFTHA